MPRKPFPIGSIKADGRPGRLNLHAEPETMGDRKVWRIYASSCSDCWSCEVYGETRPEAVQAAIASWPGEWDLRLSREAKGYL